MKAMKLDNVKMLMMEHGGFIWRILTWREGQLSLYEINRREILSTLRFVDMGNELPTITQALGPLEFIEEGLCFQHHAENVLERCIDSQVAAPNKLIS